jgi:hypothetical protein
MEVAMSMNWDAASEERRGGGCGGRRGRWKFAEIAAMVLGFIVFWPIGAAILAFKIWQQRTGYPGDLASFCTEAWDTVRSGDWSRGPFARGGQAFRGWRRGGGGWGPGGPRRARRTGNSAFDDWRDAELSRLEEERRKLEAAEREFAEYIDNLRRARDREEFDRFMNERRNGTAPGQPSSPAA